MTYRGPIATGHLRGYDDGYASAGTGVVPPGPHKSWLASEYARGYALGLVDGTPLVGTILFDFETPGEGTGGTGSYVNQGSYAVTAPAIDGMVDRVTDEQYVGVASCRLNFTGSFGFSLGGDDDLDIGGEGATIEFAYRPFQLSGSPTIFDWGTSSNDRLTASIVTAQPRIAVVRSGVATNLDSSVSYGGAIWAAWKLHVRPGGTSELFIDGVSGGTAAFPGAFTVAAFGDLLRWGRSASTNTAHCNGWLDHFHWRRGIY